MSKSSPEISALLSAINIQNDTVRFVINTTFVSEQRIKYSNKPFFSNFEIRFLGLTEAELKKVPSHILLVPFIMNVAPVLWKLGIKARLGWKADSTTCQSLQKLHDKFREIWQNERWDGELICESCEEVLPDFMGNDSAMSLYSGGVDSMSTVLTTRQQHGRYTLMTILGTDILADKNGESVGYDNIMRFAKNIDAESIRVMTNIGDFINTKLCERSFVESIHCWWRIQHGIGQSSLMAIPMWLKQITVGYIAASDHISNISAIGSRPDIDNLVRWSAGHIVHEGVDKTRQQKVEQIVSAIRQSGSAENYPIRICTKPLAKDALEINCECCEKCLRSIVAYLLAGADWQLMGGGIGFPQTTSDEILLQHLKAVFEGKLDQLFYGKEHYWQDFQQLIRQEPRRATLIPLSAKWLLAFHFETHSENSGKLQNRHQRQDQLKAFIYNLFH